MDRIDLALRLSSSQTGTVLPQQRKNGCDPSLGKGSGRPKPLFQGRDLIALGLQPSPRFKALLDVVYEAQLDGKVTSKDDAIEYVKGLIGG